MNAVSSPPIDHVRTACLRIAPTWPLDRQIAVNPWWGWVDESLPRAAAALATLSGIRALMPRAWFRQQWADGRLRECHLREVARSEASLCATTGEQTLLAQMTEALHAEEPPPEPLPLLTTLATRRFVPIGTTGWDELVTHQVSQHAAAYFDRHQSSWPLDTRQGLFGSWRRQLAADASIPWRVGRRRVGDWVDRLPASPVEAIGSVLDALEVPDAARTDYLTALLLSVQGWASWCAWLRWEAGLAQRDDDHGVHLLAARLAWEGALHVDQGQCLADAGWRRQWSECNARVDQLVTRQRTDWLLQRAMEHAYQAPLADTLRRAAVPSPAARPEVQAAFCIDVRSERLRRALESVAPEVQTLGVAGFFGLPIAYNPLGTGAMRPQLPGLLAPRLQVEEEAADAPEAGRTLAEAWARDRRVALANAQGWDMWRQSPASAFGFVEACGVAALGKLLKAGIPSSKPAVPWERAGLPAQARLQPRLRLVGEQPEKAADLAYQVLRVMGLLRDFAPIVLLVGHGSHGTNNPHAAGLACGACGGQGGEVNVRVLAGLLNDAQVRRRLAAIGIVIPADTHFVPALHDTVTDDVRCFDRSGVPVPLVSALDRLQRWLDQAGARVRAERAESLGLAAHAHDPQSLALALRRRANDWSEVRPEWGLAGNAAFVVAPRARTRGLDLDGRCFLHDYQWLDDPTGQVLESIMTGPMVVTHWINFQYYASSVDPDRMGSGSKVLHNVVGGHIGVFEGNGGDLRIGLPWQSVHDGQGLRHQPLRLSVFIEAPRAMIDAVLTRHDHLRKLVDHGWLHLLRIAAGGEPVERHHRGDWRPFEVEDGLHAG